jgi:RimJ/RimL family protein N-acetyltransferase
MLETGRLILRQYEATDLAAIAQILGDAKTMQFWPEPFDRKAATAWLSRAMRSYEAHGFGRWLVVRKQDNLVIGDCGILKVEINGVPENDLGYIIHHPWWRQGYASEAAQACLDYGLQQLRLGRLVANMADDHAGSIAVAEKLGMKLESEFRNSRNDMKCTLIYSKEI